MAEVPELPIRRRDRREVFLESLTTLASALGITAPTAPITDRASYWAARKPVLEALKQRHPLPDALFIPLLRVAIHDLDPSFNRQFVEPLIGDFGRRRLVTALIETMRDGPDEDRPGAANAWYWAWLPLSDVKDAIPKEDRPPGFDHTKGSGVQFTEACLQTFLSTDDTKVRQAIAGILFPSPPDSFPEHLREQAREVVALIRASRDDYMNNRVGSSWPN